jgi:hypothetical protein
VSARDLRAIGIEHMPGLEWAQPNPTVVVEGRAVVVEGVGERVVVELGREQVAVFVDAAPATVLAVLAPSLQRLEQLNTHVVETGGEIFPVGGVE